MSLVMDAMGTTRVASRSNSTSPLLASVTRAEADLSSGPERAWVTAAASTAPVNASMSAHHAPVMIFFPGLPCMRAMVGRTAPLCTCVVRHKAREKTCAASRRRGLLFAPAVEEWRR